MSKFLDVCLCFYLSLNTWGTGGADKSSPRINLRIGMYTKANYDK